MINVVEVLERQESPPPSLIALSAGFALFSGWAFSLVLTGPAFGAVDRAPGVALAEVEQVPVIALVLGLLAAGLVLSRRGERPWRPHGLGATGAVLGSVCTAALAVLPPHWWPMAATGAALATAPLCLAFLLALARLPAGVRGYGITLGLLGIFAVQRIANLMAQLFTLPVLAAVAAVWLLGAAATMRWWAPDLAADATGAPAALPLRLAARRLGLPAGVYTMAGVPVHLPMAGVLAQVPDAAPWHALAVTSGLVAGTLLVVRGRAGRAGQGGLWLLAFSVLLGPPRSAGLALASLLAMWAGLSLWTLYAIWDLLDWPAGRWQAAEIAAGAGALLLSREAGALLAGWARAGELQVPAMQLSLAAFLLAVFALAPRPREAAPAVAAAAATGAAAPAVPPAAPGPLPLPPFLRAAGLTPREASIAALLLQGYSNAEMARILYISENTLKFHLKGIFGKAGVQNRRQLLARALQEHN